MNKKGVLLLITVVLILTVVGCIGSAQFFATGIHVFGRYAHIDVQEACYFIDPETNEVTGSSVFTISGILFDRHGKMFGEDHEASPFSGHMEVAAYPVSLTEGFQNQKGMIGKNVIAFSGQGRDFNDMQTRGTYYNVEILRSDPETVVIYVYPENGAALVAVCGKDEADAMNHYQQYLERRFS